MHETAAQNIFGEPLIPCCFAPVTGFYRDGSCHTGPEDVGLHLVCAQMTEAFLRFSQEVGNDLSTPRPEYDFVGLQPGDFWCLCVLRWKEAYLNGCAPLVRGESTHIKALEHVTLEQLTEYQVANG